MTTHSAAVRRISGEQWRTVCRCGYWSPIVADKRTAVQARAAHLAKVDAS